VHKSKINGDIRQTGDALTDISGNVVLVMPSIKSSPLLLWLV